MLGFVSMFMDISSELIHSLLPLFMVSSLGASAMAVGMVEGLLGSDRSHRLEVLEDCANSEYTGQNYMRGGCNGTNPGALNTEHFKSTLAGFLRDP
jgi:hypothetical protein